MRFYTAKAGFGMTTGDQVFNRLNPLERHIDQQQHLAARNIRMKVFSRELGIAAAAMPDIQLPSTAPVMVVTNTATMLTCTHSGGNSSNHKPPASPISPPASNPISAP